MILIHFLRTGVHRIRKKRGAAERGVGTSHPSAAGPSTVNAQVGDQYSAHYQYMPYMHPDQNGGAAYGYGGFVSNESTFLGISFAL